MTNSHARSASETLPSDLIREELQKRLRGLPTASLVRLLRESSPPPALASTPPEGRPTVRALVRRVLGRSSMRSQDVVAAVQTLRPGTPAPTVRSDLSRMRAAGELRAVGPVRGGKLRVA